MSLIWRQQQVEDLALISLLEFRRKTGKPLRPPLDVDLVGEILCGLQWDWDVLPEPPGTRVWAALYPDERRVVMNETHSETFAAKSGLERFTKAHEIGHWVLHVQPGGTDAPILSHATPHYHRDQSGEIDWIERHADWFAAALLMPASVFVPIAEDFDLADWKSHHELARLFDVTLSALRVRLMHLKLWTPQPL